MEVSKQAIGKGMKLTKQQNKVINCLQNAWVLIADSESAWIAVAHPKGDFIIGTRLFWNLVEKGLIYQELRSPYDYILTALGEEIKTKDVQKEVLTQQENQQGQKELPTITEAGVIAIDIASNHVKSSREEAFFIAGFQECVKYLNTPNKPKEKKEPINIKDEDIVLSHNCKICKTLMTKREYDHNNGLCSDYNHEDVEVIYGEPLRRTIQPQEEKCIHPEDKIFRDSKEVLRCSKCGEELKDSLRNKDQEETKEENRCGVCNGKGYVIPNNPSTIDDVPICKNCGGTGIFDTIKDQPKPVISKKESTEEVEGNKLTAKEIYDSNKASVIWHNTKDSNSE